MRHERGRFAPLPEEERVAAQDAAAQAAAASDELGDAKKAPIAERLWAEAVPEHPLLKKYLTEERGIPKWGDTVRLHPSVPYSFTIGIHHPAVLMLRTNAAGEVVGLHAIFLDADGRKAIFDDPEKSAKKSFGRGGVVVLRAKGSRLLVAEGPEDALMAAAACPDAAAICTAGAGTLYRVADHADGYEVVVLLAQRDDAWHRDAPKAADQLIKRGKTVLIAMPPEGFKDIAALGKAQGIDAVRATIEAAIPWDQAAGADTAETGCEDMNADGEPASGADTHEDATDEAGAKGLRRRRDPTQADTLIQLAQSADLFHAPDGTAFADIDVNGHRETWPIRGKGFRSWLARCFYLETGGAPSTEALQSALNVIEAKARFDAPERIVSIRVGGLGDRLYIDLGDATWRAVEIDSSGWRVVDNPPVRFRRAAGMRPLPVPISGRSIETLRSFLNLQSDADFVLVVAWALAVFRNRGPYPVLVLSGEQGSAKSTFSAILRALLDPNTAPLRALPREDRDLFIAATNGHVLAFDNVSSLPPWISDTLCRLATGGGFAVRQLYTDQDEVLFDAARPVILNGIEDMVARPDLADRALFLTLEPIPEERRRAEHELWAAFEKERPRILGVLLDAVVLGLQMLPETRLKKLPRMADFALWATACETAFWPAGTFWSAYCGNRDEAVEGVIEADPVAAAVRALMAKQPVWTGTASQLMSVLAGEAGEPVAKSKTWPHNPRALANRLRRAASFLRKAGIEIAFRQEGHPKTRMIHITRPEKWGAGPSASSASSATDAKPNSGNSFAASLPRTVPNDADGRADDRGMGDVGTVRANPLKTNSGNAADGADAKIPPQSAPGKTNPQGWTAWI
jgi:hypothetical protein